jgi:hypothetical protein
MKKLSLLIPLALALSLTACGTTNSPTSEQIRQPIPKGQSRIVISRSNSPLYFAASAEVRVNRKRVAGLGPGGGAVRDVKAGTVLLDVTTPGSFGRYSLEVEAVAGQTYKVMVSPRDGNFPLVATFGVIGDAVNSAGDDQSGYFQIELVP